MPEEPRRNVQFGRKIGVDDTGPPEVAHGSRAGESRTVDDAVQGQHVRFVRPLDERPPPEEASHASEYGLPPPGPPEGDASLPVEAPSVWDASETEDED